MSRSLNGADYISRGSRAIGKDRQSLRCRRSGRGLAGDHHAPRASPTPATGACACRRPARCTTLTGNPVLDAGGAPIMLDASGGAPTISRRRHDHPERQAGRRDRPVQHRRQRQAHPRRQFRRHSRQAGRPPCSTSPPMASLQGYRRRTPTSIRSMEMTKLITVTRAFDGVNAAVSQNRVLAAGRHQDAERVRPARCDQSGDDHGHGR